MISEKHGNELKLHMIILDKWWFHSSFSMFLPSLKLLNDSYYDLPQGNIRKMTYCYISKYCHLQYFEIGN